MIAKNIVIQKTPQVEDLTNLYKQFYEERQENKKEFIIGVNADSTKFYRIQGYASFQHPNGYNSISLQEVASILKLNEEQTKKVLTNCDYYFDGENLNLDEFSIIEEEAVPLPQENKETERVNEQIITGQEHIIKIVEDNFKKIDELYAKAIYENKTRIEALENKQNSIIKALESLKNVITDIL